MGDERSRGSRREPALTRRELLGTAAAIGGATALAGCGYGTQLHLARANPEASGPRPEWAGSRVRRYRPLGGTGFEVSDISCGCADLTEPAVARLAFERGVNYFDTSPDYADTRSERAVGEGLRDVARDRVFIASKFCTPRGHLSSSTPVARVIEAVEDSLRRIGTDYLDLVHIHAVNSIDRLMAPTLHEAFDRLKQAGKVRFLGVSSHTPRLETVMRHAVDSGRFHVIMVAYNFQHWPALPTIFRDARERGVGVVAMKTLKGAYHTELADFSASERASFAQAAFAWVLGNRDVSGLVISIREERQLDEYLYASGRELRSGELALLEKYDRAVTGRYCRPGCGACLASCPHTVPVDDLFRYEMYARSYGREAEARRLYAGVAPEHSGARCLDCAAPCAGACDDGISIREGLVEVHRRLAGC